MKRLVLALCALLVVVAGGVAGYAFGHGRAPDDQDARAAHHTAYVEAFRTSKQRAYKVARTRGADRGESHGQQTGRHDGTALGVKRGKTAAEAATPAPTTTTTASTESCPAGQYNYEGNGCVPLNCPGSGCAHPPTPPATPASCPPGQVPVGITGACAPGTPYPDATEPSPTEVCSDPALAEAAGYSCP